MILSGCEPHTTMTCVRIRHNRSKVVHSRTKLLTLRYCTVTSPPLLSIMEDLSSEKLGDLVRNCIGRVVLRIQLAHEIISYTLFERTTGGILIGVSLLTCKIRTGFKRAASGRRALPPRDIHRLEVLCHLGDLYRIQSDHSM